MSFLIKYILSAITECHDNIVTFLAKISNIIKRGLFKGHFTSIDHRKKVYYGHIVNICCYGDIGDL